MGAAMHTDGVDAKALAAALVKATTDEKQITKARVVGEMIRKVCFTTHWRPLTW